MPPTHLVDSCWQFVVVWNWSTMAVHWFLLNQRRSFSDTRYGPSLVSCQLMMITVITLYIYKYILTVKNCSFYYIMILKIRTTTCSLFILHLFCYSTISCSYMIVFKIWIGGMRILWSLEDDCRREQQIIWCFHQFWFLFFMITWQFLIEWHKKNLVHAIFL
jgi:hypothetical protein